MKVKQKAEDNAIMTDAMNESKTRCQKIIKHQQSDWANMG